MYTKIVLKNWLYTVARTFLSLAPSINIVSPKDKNIHYILRLSVIKLIMRKAKRSQILFAVI